MFEYTNSYDRINAIRQWRTSMLRLFFTIPGGNFGTKGASAGIVYRGRRHLRNDQQANTSQSIPGFCMWSERKRHLSSYVGAAFATDDWMSQLNVCGPLLTSFSIEQRWVYVGCVSMQQELDALWVSVWKYIKEHNLGPIHRRPFWTTRCFWNLTAAIEGESLRDETIWKLLKGFQKTATSSPCGRYRHPVRIRSLLHTSTIARFSFSSDHKKCTNLPPKTRFVYQFISVSS